MTRTSSDRPKGWDDEDLRQVLALVAAGLAAEGCLALEQQQVLEAVDEVRLRFNSPTRVVAWRLRLQVIAPGTQRRYGGEVELFQWIGHRCRASEWELCHSDLKAIPTE